MGRQDADVFTESLLESSAPRLGWTTLLSFALQTVAIAALVLLPLFYTQALPAIVALGSLIGPPPGEVPRADSPGRHSNRGSTSELVGNTVREPIVIRKGIADIRDEGGAPASMPDLGFAVPGGTGSRDGSAQIMSLLTPPPKPSAPPPSPTRPFPISGGIAQGFLIRQVRPVYPPLAIAAHVQGSVVLSAIISRTGMIEQLHVVSGHPLLVRSAIEAVEQWRYRPYLLNGLPVDVETQITVNFILGGG